MAGAKKNVELGTVGFNLEANDSSLDSSLQKLRSFGEGVNKAAGATDESTQKIYTAMARVEKILTSAFDKVSALTDNLKKVGAGDESIRKLTGQYDALVQAATKAAKTMDPHEFTRASVGLSAASQQATRAIKEQAASTSLLEARQSALVSTWEKVANASSRMKMRGASEADLAKYNTVLEAFQKQVDVSDLSTVKLAAAQRQFNMSLGETNRELRENLAAASAAERQQSRLIQATRNVAYVNARVTRSNLPAELANNNQAALTGFGSALQGGNSAQILSAQQKLNDALMASRLAMAGAEKPVNRFSLAMHDMSKATVLALGPLSGVGSRIAVMTSLLDSNSVQMALFIGGVVAASTAIYQLTAASIKAVMEQEKFNALLTTSTGSVTLVGREYEYLLNTSNRLGVSVKGLVKSYADFASAARLSGLSLEQQRKIFESLMTTSSALRWNEEQLGRAFLAVTQMISKGTVMSEEMKKQLGELIPNVIGLGAAAEGVSTKGFMKMMKDGEVITNDFMPKFAEQLQKVFGPGSLQGAESLAGKLNVLGNSVFEFLKKFDQVSGFSELFRKGVILLTDALGFLTRNMQTIVSVFGALLGAGAGYGALRLMTMIGPVVLSVGTAMTTLATGIGVARIALIALESTTVIGWILKLGVVIAGAAAGWKLFKENADAALTSGDNINSKIQDWINQQEKMGMTQKQVRDQMAQQAGDRIGVLANQLAKEKEYLAKLEEARRPMKGALAYDRRYIVKANNEIDPELNAAKARVAAVQKQMDDLVALSQKMGTINLEPPQPKDNPDDENKGWQSWLKKISKHVEEAKGKMRELKALSEGGEGAQNLVKAMTKANELMLDMPKKAGSMAVVSARLKAAGFEGKTVVEQLTQMFLAEEKATDGIRDYGKAAREQKSAVKELGDLWEDLANRDHAIKGEVNGFSPETAKQAKKLQDNLDKLKDQMKSIGMSEEGMTATLELYTAEWTRITKAEDHQKQVEKVTKALQQMGLKVGDVEATLTTQRDKQIAFVQDGVRFRILTEEQGAKEIVRINDDMYRKLVNRTSEWHDFLKGALNSLEDGLADAFGQDDIGRSLEKTLQKLWQQLVAFAIRMSILKPMMTAAFGSEYSGNKSDGGGLFGDLLMNLGKLWVGAAGAGSGGGIDYTDPIYDGRANGGHFNPFETRWVGEDGPELLTMGKNGGNVLSNAQSRAAVGGRSGDWIDQSKNVYNFDSRSDAAQIMSMIARSHRRNNEQIRRDLKVRYG